MKKKASSRLFRTYSVILATIIILTTVPVFNCNNYALAYSPNVEINETNFSDANFRSFIEQYNTNGDNYLSDNEISLVTSIDVSYKNICSLKGIEYFYNLTDLNCAVNNLTSLDFSYNTCLEKLVCSDNQLTELNLSNNSNLKELYCGTNQLTSLNISDCTSLEKLDCSSNKLTELDVSKNTNLIELGCWSNQLKELNTLNNTCLVNVHCEDNQISELDFSNNTQLTVFNCTKNQLTKLTAYSNQIDYDCITSQSKEETQFLGWYTDESLNNYYSRNTTLTGLVTLYARYTYKVEFNNNGCGSYYLSEFVDIGSKVSKPYDPVEPGYKFDGWYKDSACTTVYDFNSAVTSNFTLYAKWTAVTTTPVPTTPAPITPAPTTPVPITPAQTTPAPEPDPMAPPKLTSGIAHVQDIGNVSYAVDTTTGILTIGTRGMGKRMEEITINWTNTTGLSGTLEYRVHVQDIGWMDWVEAGQKCGTEGMSKRIEAIEIRLTGELAEYYSVQYCVHIQDYGDMQGWVKDGALAGTTGESKRIEELKIKIVPIGTDSSMSVKYRVHVQDYGWEGSYASNGQMSGTSGESKRLEGIEIFLDGNQYSGGVKFKTHVQDYGWQGWSYDGEMSGTQGEAKRLDGICIELYGEIAEYYDIYYRVHAQDIGWMGWAKNGECAGTAGRSARLEGIQIVLVPKGSSAPGATYQGITAVNSSAFVEGFPSAPAPSPASPTPTSNPVIYYVAASGTGECYHINKHCGGMNGVAVPYEALKYYRPCQKCF